MCIHYYDMGTKIIVKYSTNEKFKSNHEMWPLLRGKWRNGTVRKLLLVIDWRLSL